MTSKTVLVLCGLCAWAGGCSPLARSTRTASAPPAESSQAVGHADAKGDSKLAELAWEQVRLATPDVAYSVDFTEGFKKGFADYLHGGSGEHRRTHGCEACVGLQDAAE